MDVAILTQTLTTPAGLLTQGGLILALLGLALVQSWRLRNQGRSLRQLQQHLGIMRQQLEQLQARAQDASPAGFSARLQQAEISGRLQTGVVHRGVPDKYRYATALAEQGLATADIAQALHMAPQEVEQAARLAQMARAARG